MEPSGRNQWQPVANAQTLRTAKNKPKPLPPVATSCRSERMIRRGSTVRVRQRAWENPLETAGFLLLGVGPTWLATCSWTRFGNATPAFSE